MSASPLPFPRGGTERWLSLAWLVVAALYLTFVFVYVQGGGLFDYIGADFRVFRASAEIALARGFGQVYDLGVQEQFQHPLYAAYATGQGAAYATVPVPYLPAFVLCFLPLLLVGPVPGFALWTILNIVVLVLYTRRLVRALDGYAGRGMLALALLCYPAFLNLFFGQVNVWLLMCLGEFFLALRRGQELRGGLWLGGLLLKPQVLVFLLPGLLLQRRFRALAGFAAAGLAILGVSLLLVGFTGLVDLGQLILLYPGELATTAPQLMMNWRALAVNLSGLVPSALAWGPAWAGLALTTAAAVFLWIRPVAFSEPRFAVVLLGTYAATCAVSWHSHIHMALPLSVLFLPLDAGRLLPRVLMNAWAIVPALVFFLAAFTLPQIAPNLAGLSMLALNLGLLGWAVRVLWRRECAAGPGPAGQAAAA